MVAEKGNKVYTIDESMKVQYQNDGFDIKNDDGNVIAYGHGKTVPYEDHMAAVLEIERLRKIIDELQAKNQEEPAELAEPEKPATKKPGKAGE